jgi:hypothetical protein
MIKRYEWGNVISVRRIQLSSWYRVNRRNYRILIISWEIPSLVNIKTSVGGEWHVTLRKNITYTLRYNKQNVVHDCKNGTGNICDYKWDKNQDSAHSSKSEYLRVFSLMKRFLCESENFCTRSYNKWVLQHYKHTHIQAEPKIKTNTF